MSNTFVNRRSLLRRPKVCKSKPPGSVVAGPTVCEVQPPSDILPSPNIMLFVFSMNDPDSPPGSDITIDMSVDVGDLFGPDTISNGGAGGAYEWEYDGVPIEADAVMEGSSVGGALCTSTFHGTWT